MTMQQTTGQKATDTTFGALGTQELLALSAKLRHAGDQFGQGTSQGRTEWQRIASKAQVEAYSLRGDVHDELARQAGMEAEAC